MRICRVDLHPCGPFAQHRFEFEAPGLHVVYGPNETGKSSTLRALSALLFGFRDDELRFGAEDPRIGGELLSPEGSRLSFWRRRGRKDTLLDERRQPLAVDALAPFLRSVNAAMFRSFFGIDWRALDQGSSDLLQERGDLAESLFGASLGGPELKRLLKDLEEQSKALWTPRTSTKGIAASLKELKALEADWKQSTVPPDKFARLRSDVEAAERAREKGVRAQSAARHEVDTLTRRAQARRLHEERERLQAELEALGAVPALPADFGARRAAAQSSLAEAGGESAALQLTRERLLRELEELPTTDPFEQHSGVLAELRGRQDSVAGWRQRLPQEQLAESQARAAATQGRAELGLAAGVPAPRPTDATRLRELARACQAAAERWGALREEQGERQAELQSLRAQLSAMPAADDPLPLAHWLEHAQRCTDTEKLRDKLALRVAHTDRDLQQEVARLRFWSGDVAGLLTYRAPLAAESDALAARWEREQRQGEELSRDLARVDETLATLQAQHQEIDATTPPDQVTEARALRQAGWRDFQAGQCSAEGFQRLVEAADAAADRLLACAERHARRVALQQSLSVAAAERDALHTRAAEADARTKSCRQEWLALWAPLLPGAPDAMRSWHSSHSRILENSAQLEAARLELAELETWLNRNRREIAEAAGLDPASGFETLVCSLRARHVACQESQTRRQDVASRLQALTQRETRDSARLSEAEAAARRAAEEWRAQLEALGLSGQLSWANAEALSAELQALHTAERERERARLSAEECARGLEQHAAAAASLVAALAPELASLPPELAVAELGSRQVVAAASGRARVEKQAALEGVDDALARHSARSASARDTLDELLKLAGCQDEHQLPEVEERWGRARDLQARVATVRAALDQSCPREEQSQLASLSAEWLEQELEEKRAAVAACDEKLRLADQKLGALQQQLEEMENRPGGAEHAQQVENLHGKILEDCDQYLRLQLALGLLRREMEKYTQGRQDPLLHSTSHYFRRLTRERYQNAHADYEAESDRATLFGQRGDDRVAVSAMSQGTRDQLYLALRLATLDHWMEQRGAFPLVLDDLCAQFDDERAAAALEVLAEVGQRTQILFFTHLRRDAELAAPLVKSGLATLHQMPVGEGALV